LRSFLEGLEFGLHFCELALVFRVVGQVDHFVRVVLQVVELELRAMQVGLDGAPAIPFVAPFQISLPGGRREGDEPIEQTALREAQEELGVVPRAVEVLGTLTPLYIPPSDFCITPVVGWTGTRPDWQPDAVEVAQVLEIPLRLLADPATVHRETWQRGELTVQVPYFMVRGHRVWGATAMVLSEFLAILAAGRVR